MRLNKTNIPFVHGAQQFWFMHPGLITPLGCPFPVDRSSHLLPSNKEGWHFPCEQCGQNCALKSGGFISKSQLPKQPGWQLTLGRCNLSTVNLLIQQPLVDPGRLKGSSAASAAPDLCTRPEDIKIWQTVPFCAQVVYSTSCTLPFFFQMSCACILTLLPLLKPNLPIKVTFLIIPAVGTRDMQKLEPRSCSYPTSLSTKLRETPPARAIGGLRNTTLGCNHILAELLCLTASPYFFHLILCPIPWIFSWFFSSQYFK